MPRKITLFILFLVLIFLPQVAIQAKTIDDNLTFVRVNEIINSSLFTVSDSVIIDGQINGDLIALSKNISVNGQISGDIIALTEEITINGQVDGNIRVFGSVINLNGPVARNVTVLANQVNLKTDSKISWDAYIASYNLENNGQIEGELKSYIFKNKGAKKTNLWLYLWPFIFKLFCALIVGLVLIFIGRGFLPKISKALEKNPWRSLAPGALICFLSPFVVLFLGLTLIGLPLALIILALWIILLRQKEGRLK
jgi:cytoskeletal protein CcmA (bactofilin family)